ncbi:aerobic cobaltochelatase subunit CobN [Roseovarius sp. A-2]|uniref:cobaltochelatase subunit CobN n=1 Tax=Roseovarius sp. A-2 TaxID=1570360 RepID=UPI0009B53653|nr:cobaltochelatase subunit CobN [Roseovarius sp. A-2]GAW37032.1 aerobic cobaltochelatase subunit CobN [Roseovarius sp. A-2]
MHVLFRESHGLEDSAVPTDLAQDPADLVVLSFSDSDLGAFAEGWHRAAGGLPSLRLANLSALRHPLSVDTYVEQTLAGAKGILVRLIGGMPYWDYGLRQVQALAQARGIALAVLPADGREDARLDAVSTLPVSTLRRLAELCDTGGAVAAQAALAQMALASGLYAAPVRGSKALPTVGLWTPEGGAMSPAAARGAAPRASRSICGKMNGRRVLVVFYRSYLVAADMAPVEALFEAFHAEGAEVTGLYAPSLKGAAQSGPLAEAIRDAAPDVIINLTAFSAASGESAPVLDAAGVPVFQAVMATSSRLAWAEAERGLSPADLAMHVVLPEVDGRLMGGVISFKQAGLRDPDLQHARSRHCPEPARIAALVARVGGWMALAGQAPAERRVALMLSTYPGKDWNIGHAVGLDALASAEAILSDLCDAGHDVPPCGGLEAGLQAAKIRLPLERYRAALEALSPQLRESLAEARGAPEEDALCRDGAFHLTGLRLGKALVLLQPERGNPAQRAEEYHDLSRLPCHAYVALYLWLREEADALVHIGAHGTLEWLPGKSVALSDDCWPEILTGALPVLYPFIVNDPGEAAQAKRRIGALTLGHLPPPLRETGTPDRLGPLEALLDEFSTADGLDPRRRDKLMQDIRAEAEARGLGADLGLGEVCGAEAITRIDRFVCDIKDSRFPEGLHVWGRTGACAAQERDALLAALDGRRIAAGPSGSPYRGRSDVLPTGRNLFTTDPRAVPTRAAYTQGVALAEELVRRHLQDEGDWPHGLVVDLWGSATMRTAGEEFAMALHLLGVRPRWDDGSGRVSGFEILPVAELDRPRIDVTLRVSGLFRDVFAPLSALFSQAVRALSQRDEAPDWNPYAGRDAGARVFGPEPGRYGLAMGDLAEQDRHVAGQAWLAASSWALDGETAHHDPETLRAQVAAADAFVHLQDLPETDLLMAADYAAHEAGFAAAQAVTGGAARLWHLDATDPARPRARALPEEIARTVHSRAANPAWIASMRAHGFRGAAEIAATLEHMAAFAQLAGAVAPKLFDLFHEETLGDPETDAFLRESNPGAHAAMLDRFAALQAAGLWMSRRNARVMA